MNLMITMSSKTRPFKYNVIDLIDGVKSRPCIWDKNCESYKDRVERKCAWEEIFISLEQDFESMSADERRFVEEQIVIKWSNIRDSFLKSLKTRMGRPKRKKYFLHNEMKFLIRGSLLDGLGEVETNEEYSGNEEYLLVSPKEEDSLEEPEASPSSKRSRRTKDYSNYYNLKKEFVTCDEPNESRLMNEDEAFFASLLPTVATYTVEERLDFRMEVLNLMKRINSKRNGLL